MNIARIYLRVSTEEQDLTRQAAIEHSTRAAGYYVAGIYREKASSASLSTDMSVPKASSETMESMFSDLRSNSFLFAG